MLISSECYHLYVSIGTIVCMWFSCIIHVVDKYCNLMSVHVCCIYYTCNVLYNIMFQCCIVHNTCTLCGFCAVLIFL